MAVRPVFEVSMDNRCFVRRDIEFKYNSGFSGTQKRKNIESLHRGYLSRNKGKRILEISSASEEPLGVKLSAFNLMIKTKNGNEFSVESAFQSSKVFENGGPYKDLLNVSSKEAKRDERLKNSGRIVSFKIDGDVFETEPKTFFYNWLYINTLHLHKDLAEQVMNYDAFTDIAFNPKKSVNCQAEAAAIYVSLVKQRKIDDALASKGDFKRIVYSPNP